MKIAMMGHKRIPSREGGVEIVVTELATRLVSLGQSVTVYNRKGHHIAGEEYDSICTSYKGVNIKYVPTLKKRGLSAVTSSFCASCLIAFKDYDVVHIHAEGPALFCFIPKLFKKKVIVTIHGLDWKRSKWGGLASKYIRLGEYLAVKYADHIIVLSQNTYEYFLNTYQRKTIFIPNGITQPIIKASNQITKKWGLTNNSYILFLGRLVPEKGLEYLLQAWKNIASNKTLVIAGGHSDTEVFVTRLKSRATSNVIFTGFVQGEILEELYSNAYIYVLPSDVEGMPISLLEAMSYGNCCLVSDIPESIEVVEDKATTFRKSDVADLKNRLEELINNEHIVNEYKEQASSYICQKYNWNDITKKTLDLYRR